MKSSCLAAASVAFMSASRASSLTAGRAVSSSKLSLSFVEKGRDDAGATTALFIHGLDSSSQTWRGVMQSLATPSVAIDCRGCGRSDLGDPRDFSPDALVEDVKSLVNAHPLLQGRKFVLVGHSMGGRVAMNYCAKYPEDVSALVVEDMDIRRRSVDSNFIPNFDEARAVAFERKHETMDSCKEELERIGYKSDMYTKWIDEGRIREDESGVWSNVNPAFRALCYRTIFDSNSGSDAWSAIAANLKREVDCGSHVDCAKVHLMVAGIGTVCDKESVEDMRKAIPGDLLSVKTYGEGTHSIHNSARDEFLADLERIIEGSDSGSPRL
ncbi:hypothetical protein ACHAXT_006622 [Thalassiosira profunda]